MGRVGDRGARSAIRGLACGPSWRRHWPVAESPFCRGAVLGFRDARRATWAAFLENVRTGRQPRQLAGRFVVVFVAICYQHHIAGDLGDAKDGHIADQDYGVRPFCVEGLDQGRNGHHRVLSDHRARDRYNDAPVLTSYTPMAPTLVREPFHRDGWVYEEKVDGWRMLAYKDGSRVRLVSRNGRDHTRRFAGIAAAVASCRRVPSCSTARWRSTTSS